MIAKALGQLIMTVLFSQVVPVDAAWFGGEVDAAYPAPIAYLVPAGGKTRLPLSRERGMAPPKKINPEIFGVTIDAASAMVVDVASGATLFAKNPDEPRPMGSITKLMTALVFLDGDPNLAASATLKEEDYTPGGRVYLNYNDSVSVADLLGATLVGSDNSAATSLKRLSGYSDEDFVRLMNEKAKSLGLRDTRFSDWTGLSADNMGSARDIVALLSAAQSVPDMKRYLSMSAYTVDQASGLSVTVPSTNELFTTGAGEGVEVIGGKTGYIPEAGYCVVTGFRHQGDETIAVVLGAPGRDTRFTEAATLARFVYKNFLWPTDL